MSISDHQQNLQGETPNIQASAVIIAIPIGLIVAIIVPATILSIFVGLGIATGYIDGPKNFDGILASMMLIGIFAMIFGGFQVATFGLLAVLAGLFLKLIRWWSSIIVGFLLGCLPYAPKGLSAFKNTQFTGDFWLMCGMGILGAIGGLSFWLIWRLFK